MSEMKHPRLLKAVQIKAQEQTFHHPWNKKSEITGVMLGRTLGLVHLPRNSYTMAKPFKWTYVGKPLTS